VTQEKSKLSEGPNGHGIQRIYQLTANPSHCETKAIICKPRSHRSSAGDKDIVFGINLDGISLRCGRPYAPL
jgi:hypothetical protein